ncbi:MAG: hypothetical protein U0694_03965 [Anaerolineae bacterium]
MVLLCAGFFALLRGRWLAAALLLGLLPVVRSGRCVCGRADARCCWRDKMAKTED